MTTILNAWLKRSLPKAALCGLAFGLLPLDASAQGWPSQYKGVMLQGFYWDSYDATSWQQLESQADELAPYFKLVWIPQSASCGGKSMGYNDLYWFTHYNSSFGTEQQLRSLISTFRQKGIGTIADVVINHRGTLKDWFDFPTETYNGNTYSMSAADVCADDDGGEAAVAAKERGVSLSPNNDTGEGWGGMRDLDHNSANVQSTVKAYLHMLLDDLGYAGFRYDMTKGYAGRFTGLYNADAKPEFSVGEYFDGDKQNLIAWLNSTKVDDKVQSAAFDFALRYAVRNAANNGDWSKLAAGGLATSSTHKRYAVTFVENHDTEVRSEAEQQDPLRKDTLAANAYMLAMPGTPCVFYKHWVDCKQDLKNMIMLRNLVGVNNESASTRKESTTARCVVATTGTAGTLLAAVGTAAADYAAPDGYALAAEGYHWRYFIEKTMETAWPSLASGTYYNAPTVVLRAVSASAGARLVYTLDGSEPTASSTQVPDGSRIALPLGSTTLKVALIVGGKVSGVQTREYEVKKFSSYNITMHVNTSSVGWGNTYFWTWGGDGTHGPANTQWPGDNVATTVAQGGKQWFAKTFSINGPDDCVNFVFAKDAGTQTVDVSGIKATSYYEVLPETDDLGHYLLKDVTSDYSTAIIGIADNAGIMGGSTAVVSLDGRMVRRFDGNVPTAKALAGLAKGVYVVNGKKVVVK